MTGLDHPQPVQGSMAEDMLAYILALETNGFLEGEPGSHEIPDEVNQILNALHHVLAGGTVVVEIQSEGTPSLVNDLDSLLVSALAQTNHLRRESDVTICF